MRNTCTPVADSYRCMAKPIQYCKRFYRSAKLLLFQDPGDCDCNALSTRQSIQGANDSRSSLRNEEKQFENTGVQAFLFLLLFLIYLTTILGNLLIFLVVFLDSRLHTPMYLFVSILSLLELGYTAATIPKMLSNLLSEKKTISFSGCLLQIYFFHSLGATECYLLTAMAYDRYLAICQPLHYPIRMTPALCVKIAVGCWLGGLAGPVAEISLVSHLPFCGPNRIQHIFCDFPPVLSLACTDTSINVLVDFVINSCKILATFLLILSSYVQITCTVLSIPSAAGKRKAFSTCASHLTVVLIFYGSILFMY
ncbi:hypothetical protein MG293_001135 [Ovis ammon polii]|uniref:Olfactory receptor n=1 Tax=Ovis ammon polii TaxID=230172 RepID=A0AAD4UQV9_OVIAM|nr:hypothetical protein MG293_001135 [Ovis ammon polii]